jgi:hypothetical protein
MTKPRSVNRKGSLDRHKEIFMSPENLTERLDPYSFVISQENLENTKTLENFTSQWLQAFKS